MADKVLGNEFSNNKKVKLIAGEVYDNMPYTKKAKSYMSQGELEGKKYGNTYSIYLTDPGEVHDGLEASPDTITEYEVPVTLKNKNTSVELDAWNKLGDIESFTNEIAKPRGRKLARSVEKEVIEDTLPKAFQVVAGSANFKTLTDMSKALDEVSMAGTKVTFVKPTVAGTIANGGLANFIPDSIQKEIYGRNYLGEYANASQVTLPGLPVVKAGASACTITGTAVSGTDDFSSVVIGYKPIDTVVCAGGKKGEAFTVDGLKVVDVNGMPTDQDYTVILTSDANASNECSIAPIRATLHDTVSGKKFDNYGNPNAWFDSTFTGFDATPVLTSGASYYVGVCREDDALAFDTYRFADLPGSENETVTVDGVSVKMSKYGDGKNMQSLVRLDLPYAAGVPDARRQSLLYIKK